jgi:hypothetical protein
MHAPLQRTWPLVLHASMGHVIPVYGCLLP